MLKPLTALRILTSAATVLLLPALFFLKDSPVASFLIGVAAGLSIGAQTFMWNKNLSWRDLTDRNELTNLNLR